MDAFEYDRFMLAQEERGPATVVRLRGELDLAHAGDVTSTLTALADVGRPALVDLDQLEFMDSSGLRALLQANERASSEGWELRFTRGSEAVQHLLSAAGVVDRLPYA